MAIVLLDVDMPVLDGNEVCRRLRADARFRTVPIVIVTGHQDSAAIRRAFEAGATDFISKPVNWALLPHRLEYILRNAAAAEHIERLAYYDTLTGLPNRRRCIDLLGSMLVAAERASGESVAVIYLDLNNFKRVNDTFGHSVGDAVLLTVAGRLTQNVGGLSRRTTRASWWRVSAATSSSSWCATRKLATSECGSRRRAATRSPRPSCTTPSSSTRRRASASPCIPDDGADVGTVLKHADTAMYQAKSGAAGPIAVYAPAMSNRLRHWLELEAKLRRAVDNDLLTLVFQPKFSLANNGSSASKRCCAGATTSTAISRRRASSRSPRTAA